MKQRPLCFLCFCMLAVFVCCRLFSLPVFGEPALTEEQRAAYAEGVSAGFFGTVMEKSATSKGVRLILTDVRITRPREEVHFPKLLVYLDESVETVSLQAVLSGKGSLRPIEAAGNPGQFDAASYYAGKRIYYQLTAESWCLEEAGGGVRESLFRLREHMTGFLSAHMHPTSAGLLAAMLWGDKTELSEDSKRLFQRGGCLHLLVISGLHVTLLGMGVLRILQHLRLPPGLAGAVASVLMLVYTALTGAPVAAVRACIMFQVFLFARIQKRSYDSANALAFAAILLLLANPGHLFSASFQLSFAASIGAALLAPLWQKRWRSRFPLQGGKGIVHRFRYSLRQSVGLWTAVQVCTLPLLAFYFYEIPVWSLPLNLLLVPLAEPILLSGAAGSLLGLFLPSLGKTLLFPADIGLLFMEYALSGAQRLPGGTWICGKPALWQIGLYYVLLLLWLRIRRRFLPLLALLGLFCRFDPSYSITMLDVGQGDCLVLRAGSAVFLSDGGSTDVREVGKNRILPYLESQGIRHVTGVFLSHDDADHENGVEELLVQIAERKTSLRIDVVWMPAWMRETEDGRRIETEGKKAGCNIGYLVRGDQVEAGDMLLRVCHPFPPEEGNMTGVETAQSGNAGSLVLDLQCRGWRVLLTGDLEGEGEERLLTYLPDIDVLKVAHHGSRNSTSEQFLAQTKPEIALLSAPRKSFYGHPHAETLARLKDRGIDCYQTREDGAITLEFLPEECRICSYLSAS